MAKYKYLNDGEIVDTKPKLDRERECRRISNYYSPTQLTLFERQRAEWVLRYVYGCSSFEQTQAMAIGGAFDCYAKAAIAAHFGVEFDLESNLNRAIQIKDVPTACIVRADAAELFDSYAVPYAAMIRDMEASKINVSTLEMEVKRTFTPDGCNFNILGIPDLTYETLDGVRVILDWKVNGRYSARGGSVLTNFVKCLPPTSTSGANGAHKKVCALNTNGMLSDHQGFRCNAHSSQIATYGLACGEDEIIAWIEQLVCRPGHARTFAVVRGRLDCRPVLERYKAMHSIIESGHYFDKLTRSESDSQMHNCWVEAVGEQMLA